MTDCHELPPQSYTATEGDRSATAPTAEEAYALLRAISTNACPTTFKAEAAKPAPLTLADGKTRGEQIAGVLLTMDRIGVWKFRHPFETGWGDYVVALATESAPQMIDRVRSYIAMAIDCAIADEREACAKATMKPRVSGGEQLTNQLLIESHKLAAAAIRARK